MSDEHTGDVIEPETPPSPWPRPEIAFDDADTRRIFQQALVDARDYYTRASALDIDRQTEQTARGLVNGMEALLDRMGAQTDDTASVAFETPSELQAATQALFYVSVALRRDESLDAAEKDEALANVAEIAAVVSEAHWRDNVFEDLSGVGDR